MNRRRAGWLVVGICTLAGLVAGITNVPTATSQQLTVNVLAAKETPQMDPDWSIWAKVPGVDVPLTAQAATYPNGGPLFPSVNLKAVHYDNVLYVMAAWRDASNDSDAYAADAFSDAAALEFPAKAATSVPSFCMGQPDTGVNIWYWRADAQAGLPDQKRSFGLSYIDGWPKEFDEDSAYFPARMLKNPIATDAAAQNLVAKAFGTLSPARRQEVNGHGTYKNGLWYVVFARPFAGGDPALADFERGKRTDMAVALWDGANGDRDGQKAVSQFVTLNITGTSVLNPASNDLSNLMRAIFLGGAAVLAAVGIVYFMMAGPGRRRRLG